ncbi:DUF2274 domain-containing protein [Acidovorax sp. JMULE5]|uniref:DUF2274 domain-containing protein n=1 Tax=Acidovorax sp. JMULE5 TaxID=2518343 RepID=UPI0015A299AC|nr:DUF2274 domain-containing protein [Acidovorax sp. JMULE5]QLA82553.1 DUF2274 domain-containing protein [Acidovorax sp. JMULE5]
MSKGPNRLSLGALPRSDAVKLTITLSAELKAQLDAYAEVHGRVYQAPVDAVALIPHILGTFILRDRGFKAFKSKREKWAHPDPAVADTAAR